jgi:hypothetical protein
VFLTLIVVLSVGIYKLFDLVIIPGKDKEIENLKKENLELKLNLKTLETQNVVKKETQNVKKEVSSQIRETHQEQNEKHKEIREAQERLMYEVRQIKKKLEQRDEYDIWSATRFPDTNVVRGLEGYYYVIDIRDAYKGEILEFKKGEYTIDEFDKKFRDSFADFTKQILRELVPKNIPHGIFIKGSADILGHNTFKRNFETLYVFKEVKVYPKVSGTSKYRYIKHYTTDYIMEPIGNSNLPNLRARFLQLKLLEVYPEIKEAPILDGNVDSRLGQAYRNAMLLLFVEWPGYAVRER